MEGSPTLTIKLHNSASDIRRFAVARTLSFSELSASLATHRPVGAPATTSLFYVDDEGDFITLESDSDLQECVRLLAPNAVLHLHVMRPGAPAASDGPREIPIQRDATPTAATESQPQQPTNPLAGLMGLAHTPQGSALLRNFGLTPDAAQQMLAQFAGGGAQLPPHVAQMMSRFGVSPDAARLFAQQSVQNSNIPQQQQQQQQQQQHRECTVDVEEDVAPGVAICDVCDAPISGDELRWTCTVCSDYDMHDGCRVTHNDTHQLVTQFATQQKLDQLREFGIARSALLVDMLNAHKGDVTRVVEDLLKQPE